MTHHWNDIGALALRLALGVMYVAHGAWKLLTLGMPATVEFFVAQGFPGWTAYAVVGAELVGGALLILGLGVRLVALALLPILLGALLVHLPNGFVFSYPNGGWEYPAFLIVASLVQALIGEGAFALQRAVGDGRLDLLPSVPPTR
jgi:putative oxidoreductase